MGLITGLVSTVVHVAAGRNPYGHNHNQAGHPVVTTAGYAADPSSSSYYPAGPAGPVGPAGPAGYGYGHGCAHSRDGQPCGICSVALPFGKGRQQKRERRAMRHAAKAQRFSNGRYPGYVPGYVAAAGGAGVPQFQDFHQQQQQGQQQMMYNRAGPSTRQEDGVDRLEVPWESRRRASTGGDMPPPAYEEAGSSRIAARRSVEVLGDGDEKRTDGRA